MGDGGWVRTKGGSVGKTCRRCASQGMMRRVSLRLCCRGRHKVHLTSQKGPIHRTRCLGAFRSYAKRRQTILRQKELFTQLPRFARCCVHPVRGLMTTRSGRRVGGDDHCSCEEGANGGDHDLKFAARVLTTTAQNRETVPSYGRQPNQTKHQGKNRPQTGLKKKCGSSTEYHTTYEMSKHTPG